VVGGRGWMDGWFLGIGWGAFSIEKKRKEILGKVRAGNVIRGIQT
jgi:hypothetical protein